MNRKFCQTSTIKKLIPFETVHIYEPHVTHVYDILRHTLNKKTKQAVFAMYR